MKSRFCQFKHTARAAIAALAIASSPLYAAPLFSDIYIFGDSLSDTGNTRSEVPFGSTGTVAALAGYGPNGLDPCGMSTSPTFWLCPAQRAPPLAAITMRMVAHGSTTPAVSQPAF
ncbi:unnamed protein product [Laminaria digitata]